jgi:hypothetical protein
MEKNDGEGIVMVKELDIRDISIIDELPVYNIPKRIMTIGCGKGRIETHLSNMGYTISASDYDSHDEWEDSKNLNFSISNIFDISTYPQKTSPIVICSEVLEHLPEYKRAFRNLLDVTETRLIVTIPWERSFNDTSPPPQGHCNHWSDTNSNKYKNVNEFIELSSPYSVSIRKIRTKPKDKKIGQMGYIIVVDKRQKWM